jgi:pyruvate dehydrogenase E2 component (dihydrolipoamide acetyltransferase)
MPALELAQETGKVIRWLKAPGDRVAKGDPIVEIETDKVTVEIEAPESGFLGEISAREGDVVPVGRTIAVITEQAAAVGAATSTASARTTSAVAAGPAASAGAASSAPVKASPLARRIAEQHGVDLAQIKTATGKIEKADVLAFVENRKSGNGGTTVRTPASPKARRLAKEQGLDVGALAGSGPDGAVLALDVLTASPHAADVAKVIAPAAAAAAQPEAATVGTIWRVMAERMTQSWTTAPHFYLVREVNAGRLVSWLPRAQKQTRANLTYTDLLVKLVAAALKQHPAAMGSWKDGTLVRNTVVNVGLAVAIEAGLVVPVIHRVDTLSLAELAARRADLVARSQSGKLRPADIQGGVFTISNLGMYGVDAFNAIVNPPQAAILAVGRIADRVVAVNGQPAVQPMMMLTLSCDHRAIDGARGARFLGALADLVEEPLGLLT